MGQDGMTAAQQGWYDCMKNTPFEDYEWRNWMCKCKPQSSKSVGGGVLTVDPVCLPSSYTPPEGGLMGGASGRVWTLDPENACTGNAFTIFSTGVPGSTDIIITWAEDFNAATGRGNAHIHVTRLSLTGGSYQVAKDLTLPNCVFNGGIVFNKRGDIATYCLAECPSCKGDATYSRFEPFLVEIKADLSGEIRRVSSLHPSCKTEDKYCYAVNRGSLFHWLKYDPVRDVYAMWYNGGWENHVGDVMTLLEADPAKDLPRLDSCDRLEAGWTWECNKGHTTGTKMVYHPEFQDFGAMCTTDMVSYGMRYRRVYQKTGARYNMASNENTYSASATWPGSMVACGCHFYTVYHGVRMQGDYNANRGTGLGFMRTDPIVSYSNPIPYMKWLSSDTVSVRSARLAILGNGDGCNRFALGWGEMDVDQAYPTKFFIVEVDSEGTFLTEKLEVTEASFWGEDDEWVTMDNGDVTWTSTWKRNDDGSPNKVGQDATTLSPAKDGKITCTFGGQNTGYGHSNARHFNTVPDWDASAPKRTWGTTGFKTNEMFVSKISASKRIGSLTKQGWTLDNSPTRLRHPDCSETPLVSDACREEFDLTESPATMAPPPTPMPVVSLPPSPVFPSPVVPPFQPRTGCTQLSGDTGNLDYPMGADNYPNNANECWDLSCAGELTLTWTLMEVEEDGGDKLVVGGNDAFGFSQARSYVGEGGTSKDKLPTTFVGGAKISISTDGDYRYAGFTFDWTCNAAPPTPAPPAVPPTTEPTPAPAGTPAPPAVTDECTAMPAPCAVGQTCADPDTLATSLKDFTCTCDNDMTIKATGTAATCDVDECVAAMGMPEVCGTGQTCNDPDTKYASQHDFVCTCDNDAAITKVDGPATCFSDECMATPCPVGQTCLDPNQSPSSVKDFTCTCDSDMTIKATGTAATCDVDECVAAMGMPEVCGTGQTCNDPDTKYASQHDFVCTCDNDAAITKVDGPATCFSDECMATPCPVGQTCLDPNQSPSSVKDFTCTCDNDMTIKATGTAATCDVDECVVAMGMPEVCGTGQTCNDPDTKYASQHDFVCTCDNDAAITKVDGPATCFSDECMATPCPVGQTCLDPNQSPSSVKDFTCTCDNDMTIKATGTAATCDVDECVAAMGMPEVCGTGQTCNDPDTKYASQHDFVCTCDNDAAITKVDGPATCFSDECMATPCPVGQTCLDPNQSPSSVKDFTCTCDNDMTIKATGTQVAQCEVDECQATPCGAGQACVDLDTKLASTNDFECTCDSDPSISQLGAPAVCVLDECLAMPCATQTCTDTMNGPNSLMDFECECANGVKNTGAPATCMVGSTDECAAMPPPCGGQMCSDPDTTASSTGDFVCTCVVGTGTDTGVPAACVVDECLASPCGPGQGCSDPVQTAAATGGFVCTCPAPSTGSATGAVASCEVDECAAMPSPCLSGQTCLDMSKAPADLKDFTCTCTNGVMATGGAATCEKDECAVMPAPCGMGQTCNDPNTKYTATGDFTCTCDTDSSIVSTNGPATCSNDECSKDPCAMGQTCNDPDTSRTTLKDFTCTCTNGVMATGGAATCEKDECAVMPAPCGMGQTCSDPNTKYTATGDFTCTCDTDSSIVSTNGPATCSNDECSKDPCAMGQTCNDPDTSRTTLKDFTCTCTNGVMATGGAATCEKDECAVMPAPCGMGQTCNDPNTKYTATGDFTCSCDTDSSIVSTNGPATCSNDECSKDPCAMGQTCNDPDTSRTTLKDFTCTCTNGVMATGGAATCEKDECAVMPAPCGMEQTCNDPNTKYTATGDFTCTCDTDSSIVSTNGPATCSNDECSKDPCAMGQTCNDPDTSRTTLKDFTCTCTNGVMATGGAATCELDECEKKPCGNGQTCVDADRTYTVRLDYLCTCANTGTTARGESADCSKSATTAPSLVATTAPSYAPNTIVPTFPPNTPSTTAPTFPPNTPSTTAPTFPPNTPSTTAPTFPPNTPSTTAPTFPPNTPSTTAPTFPPNTPSTTAPTFPPNTPSTTAPTFPPNTPSTTAPTFPPNTPSTTAPTFPPNTPSTTAPTFPPNTPSTTAPTFPPNTPSTTAPTFPPNTPSTTAPTFPPNTPATTAPTLPPGVEETLSPEKPKVVVKVGRKWKKEEYKKLVSKRTGEKIDDIIVTVSDEDVDGTRTVTTEFSGKNGKDAAENWEEEVSSPDKDLKDVGVLGAGDLEETASSADDDSGMPWWIWVLIAGGVLLACGMMAALAARKHKNKDDVSLKDFMETEAELSQYPTYSDTPSPQHCGRGREFTTV